MEFFKRKKRIVSFLLFFFVASAFLFTGCSKKNEVVNKDNEVAVKVLKTAIGNIEDMETFTGKIEAEDQVNLASKVTGRVKEVNFQVGDYVKEGDPLIELETDELNHQLSQAEAAVASAKANLAAMNDSLAASKANLAANEVGTLPQQLDQAKAAFQQAESNYTNAKADYDRTKELYDAGVVSKQALDAAELKYEVAKTQYDSGQQQLNMTENRLPKNLEVLRAQTAQVQDNIVAARAQVDQAQAQVDLIKTNIQNSVIKAPISGVISSKQINPGEMCQVGAVLGSIVNTENVKVVIDVPEEEIDKVKQGQEVEVSVDALGDKGYMKGKISIISPSSQQSKLFEIKVDLENQDHELKPGMFAKVNIARGVKVNVITIPKDAVMIKKYGNTVYVVNKGKAEERLVKTGISSGDRVEITEGLKAGETVVVSGQNMLTEGSKVKIH